MPDNEDIVYDDATVEIAVEPEDPIEPVEVPEPEPEERVISERERVYRFLAENPDELDRMRNLSGDRQQPTQAVQPANSDPRPDHRDFSSWEEYHDAKDAWMDREMERRISAAVAPINQAVAPMAAAPKVKSIASQLATRNGLDENGKAYIEQALSQVPPQQLDHLTAQDAEFLVNAAYGAQARQTPKPTGRVEPVAGVGPVRVQLNTAVVSPSEWQAYLDMRTSMGLPTSGKAFLAEMRKDGYIK